MEIKFKDNCSEDGEYTIWADGYDTAELYWTDCNGILPEWTAFGYVKIDAGLSSFDYYGGRGVPCEATHVLVKAFRTNAPDYTEGLSLTELWCR